MVLLVPVSISRSVHFPPSAGVDLISTILCPHLACSDIRGEVGKVRFNLHVGLSPAPSAVPSKPFHRVTEVFIQVAVSTPVRSGHRNIGCRLNINLELLVCRRDLDFDIPIFRKEPPDGPRYIRRTLTDPS